MVLRHEAGLTFFADPADIENVKAQFLPSVQDIKDFTGIEAIIEKCAPYYGKNEFGSRGYHAETRGFTLNGIVRRVKNTTIGDFIEKEICGPLGITCLCGRSIEE
jgi:CubicO group peptidase (beta-lactamase class C family)